MDREQAGRMIVIETRTIEGLRTSAVFLEGGGDGKSYLVIRFNYSPVVWGNPDDKMLLARELQKETGAPIVEVDFDAVARVNSAKSQV